MAHHIDQIDRKILRELQADATLSVDEISAAVALSRNACWRRIKALEAAGVIRGRVALLDPRPLGCGLTVMALVRTNAHEAGWMTAFRRAVETIPEIVGAYRMSGELDYLLKIRVADVAEYDAVYKRLIERVPLADISASFVMEEIKETTALPL